MLSDNFLTELRKIVGEDYVLSSPEDLVCYSYDAVTTTHLPDVVVFPASAEEVSAVLKVANGKGIPVVPRGGGTNICGASVPIKGGIVLAMNRMNKILEIDTENLVAVVQPGVVTGEFQRSVEAHGLFFPPDPQALNMSTIGGNVATNAGGPRGFKYGVTRDYVLGMQVVLADGRVMRVGGKTIKNVTGYDLTKLFTGSEGTLGVFTELTLRLIPLPEDKRTLLAIFDALPDGARAVSAIIKAKIIPTTLELMDQEAMQLIEASRPCGLPTDAASAILIEVDGSPVDVPVQIKKVAEVCAGCGAREVRVAATEEEAAQLWASRKAAFAAMARSTPTVMTEDITVPRNLLPVMVEKIKQIARKYQLRIPILGHTGDGNLHPIICTDERNAEEMARVHVAVDEMFREALALGGTLSGEHGIGLEKKKYLEWELGRTGVDVMRDMKRALDPNGILNPGKIFLREDGE